MDDNFEKWMAQWAQAEKEIAEEESKKVVEQPRTSFFTNSPSAEDFAASEEGSDDWRDIYQRAMEVDYSEDSLLTDSVAYAGEEGFGKQIPLGTPPSPGGKKVFTNQPVHFSSVGTDQDMRVTDNWSDGKELLELDEMKRKIEEMERRFHESDVLNKGDRSKIQSELDSLRSRVEKLSEKISSNPQKDLT